MDDQDVVSNVAMGGVGNVFAKKYYPEADSHTIQGSEFI